MTIEDTIISEAAALHRHRPSLTPQDWRVLGEIIEAGAEGLAFMKIREEPEVFGTGRRLYPTLDRLIAEGLIEKIVHGKGQGAPVYFKRTSAPIIPFALPVVAAPAAPAAPVVAPQPMAFVL